MKVYYDGDSNWYASPWDIDETSTWLSIDSLEECNLDTDGMWYPTEEKEDMSELGDCDESHKGGFGDLRLGSEDKSVVEKLTSFREVLKLQESSSTPYLIATTN